MRNRLIFSFALVVWVTIVTVLLIARQSAASEVRTFIARGGMMGMQSLADDLESYYQQFGSWQGVDPLLVDSHMGSGMGGMMGGNGPWLRVADSRGVVIADNLDSPSGSLAPAEREAAVTLLDPRGQVIGYLVASGRVVPSEADLLNRLARAGWIAAGISGVLALLLALLLSNRLLRPVQDLTHAAGKMAGGDLSQRVQVQGRDELGQLGESFNQMAISLQKAEQNRRSMTADIAHELRTPIAVQRAHLEALQDGIYPLSVENLQPILEQTELLTRLVDDLRTLALADAGELRLERAPTDLSALTRRVVDRFRPEAENRGIELSSADIENQPIQSLDSVRIEQILNNLLSNALRHTPRGGVVSLALVSKDGFAELRVKDSGPGIPPESLPRLFERFYRADPSRSRERGGTGLGLAIARQLALLHNGDLTAANRPEGGAEFTLKLPSGS